MANSGLYAEGNTSFSDNVADCGGKDGVYAFNYEGVAYAGPHIVTLGSSHQVRPIPNCFRNFASGIFALIPSNKSEFYHKRFRLLGAAWIVEPSPAQSHGVTWAARMCGHHLLQAFALITGH